MVHERSLSHIRLYSTPAALISIGIGAADKTLGSVQIPNFLDDGMLVKKAYLGIYYGLLANGAAGVNKLSGVQSISAISNGAGAVTIPAVISFLDDALYCGALAAATSVRTNGEIRGDIDISNAVFDANLNSVTAVWNQSLADAASLNFYDVQVFIDIYFI
jgi:hypothetical protein